MCHDDMAKSCNKKNYLAEREREWEVVRGREGQRGRGRELAQKIMKGIGGMLFENEHPHSKRTTHHERLSRLEGESNAIDMRPLQS